MVQEVAKGITWRSFCFTMKIIQATRKELLQPDCVRMVKKKVELVVSYRLLDHADKFDACIFQAVSYSSVFCLARPERQPIGVLMTKFGKFDKIPDNLVLTISG
jgi:hypothetical protein